MKAWEKQQRVARRHPKRLLAMTRRVGVAVVIVLMLTAIARASDAALSSTDLEAAARHFRLAEACRPGDPLRVANYSAAERIAEEFLRTHPDSADANFLLFAARGRRLLETDGPPSLTNVWKYTAVNKYLDRALQLNPNHPDALAARGGILLDLPSILGGNVQAARANLEEACRVNPTGPGTRLSLARALERQGDRRAAREQALLAAHYACIKRTRPVLVEAERLLAELDSDSL